MKQRIAITGIGCVTPVGVGIRPFFSAVAGGVSGIREITHFDCSGFDVKLAGEVREDMTRPEKFQDAVAGDPKIGFALEAAGQAMRDAGISGLSGKSLIHLGTSLKYFDLNKIVQAGMSGFSQIVENSMTPGARGFQTPLDVACELIGDIHGPDSLKLTNVSACAASTQAIGHTFQRLRDGTFDMALCGGFDSMINPLGIGGFQLLGALSANTAENARACRPFDASRNGTVLGEGAAMFVLEPLEHARTENRHIYAEILGFGSSLDAWKVSAPDPTGAGCLLAMKGAVRDAGLHPGQIDAVSAHGTGTYLNDETEAAAIRDILGEKWQTTPVFSTKSLRLHPHGALDNVAPGCELDHVVVAPRGFHGQTILKNSFGFGGQNATLILGRVEQ